MSSEQEIKATVTIKGEVSMGYDPGLVIHYYVPNADLVETSPDRAPQSSQVNIQRSRRNNSNPAQSIHTFPSDLPTSRPSCG